MTTPQQMPPSASARGLRGGTACIRAKPTIVPTSPGPPYPRTVCGGGVAAAAGDGLDFGSGVGDIFLQYMASSP